MKNLTNKEFCIMPSKLPYWDNKRFSGSHRHEAFFGIRNRQKSIDDGLVVFLTYDRHEGTNGVHGKNGHYLDNMIKVEAEIAWLKHYNKTIKDFIERYGRNYL